MEGEKRYSPVVCTGCKKEGVIGDPDPKHIYSSFVERQNLTMGMGIRRFTRLANAVSKKIELHAAAVSLHMMYYNFGRKHMTLGTSPAVAAGVANHIWTIEEIVALVDRSAFSSPKSPIFPSLLLRLAATSGRKFETLRPFPSNTMKLFIKINPGYTRLGKSEFALVR